MIENKNYTAYCFHCRKKIEMKDMIKLVMKNGINAIKGKCTICGGKMFRILPKHSK